MLDNSANILLILKVCMLKVEFLLFSSYKLCLQIQLEACKVIRNTHLAVEAWGREGKKVKYNFICASENVSWEEMYVLFNSK